MKKVRVLMMGLAIIGMSSCTCVFDQIEGCSKEESKNPCNCESIEFEINSICE